MNNQIQCPVVLVRSGCVVNARELVVVCGYHDGSYGYAVMWEGGDVVQYYPKESEKTYQQVLSDFGQHKAECKR
jgi:hypothetical protein